MTYDLAQAERLRRALANRKRVTERKMFGGICFLLRGHMLCGIGKPGFMFRIGKEQEAEALARPGARPMDFTGRRMGGLVWVDAGRCKGRALGGWIALAQNFVATLPPKNKSR